MFLVPAVAGCYCLPDDPKEGETAKKRGKYTMKYYCGLKNGNMTVFSSKTDPTQETHGDRFNAIIEPFKTKRAAMFMEDNGRNNPHCRCVQDAEKLAKREVKNRNYFDFSY